MTPDRSVETPLPMRHEFLFQKEFEIVEVRAFGRATLEGFIKLDTELVAHDLWTPGMGVLFDLRELDLRSLSVEDVRENAKAVRSLSDNFGSASFACVMTSEVDFGIARMFEMLTADGTQLKIKVFRCISEARSWLNH